MIRRNWPMAIKGAADDPNSGSDMVRAGRPVSAVRMVVALAGVGFIFAATAVRASTFYFYETTNSSWGLLNNWFYSINPSGTNIPADRLPGTADDVIIYSNKLADGVGGNYSNQSLTLLGGAEIENGSFLANTITMAGGTAIVSATVTVPTNGLMWVYGPNSISGVTLLIQTNAQMVLEPGALLQPGQGNVICVQGGIILSNASQIKYQFTTNLLEIVAGGSLTSSGTVNVWGQQGSSWTFDNSGTVICQTGLLYINPNIWTNSGASGAFETVSNNANISLAESVAVAAGVTWTILGPGTTTLGQPSTAVINGTIQVGGVDAITHQFIPGHFVADVQQTIAGSGSLQVLASNNLPSSLTMTEASINATTINIQPQAILNISNFATFVSNSVNNAGTVFHYFVQPFASVTLGGGAVFNNATGGTYVVVGDPGGIVGGTPNPPAVFNNAGTFRIASGGANAINLGTAGAGGYPLPFNNSGLLDVEGGTVNLEGGTNSGQINVTNGAALVFTGPRTNFLNAGATFTGAGSLQLNSEVFVNGNVSMPNLLAPSGSVIDGPGQLTITGVMNWQGATVQGSGALNIASGGTLNLAAGAGLAQRTLNNTGTFNVTSATLNCNSGAVVNNLAGGLMIFQGNDTLTAATPAFFNNYGTIQCEAAGGPQIQLNFTNAGLFEVLTGSVNIPVYPFVQTAGSTVVEAGTSLMTSRGFNLQGGTLEGTGTLICQLTNSSVVHPGMSPGILTLSTAGGNNSYTQAVLGALSIDIGGTNAGTQYSQLGAAGVPVNLGGSLNVNLINGFTPTAGQTFTILTCGSRTGTFPILNGAYLGTNLALVPVYSSTSVVLVASNVVVLRPLISVARAGVQGANFLLSWPAVVGQPYQAEYSPDLFQWFVLSNFVASVTNTSLLDPTPIPNVPKRFYRLH